MMIGWLRKLFAFKKRNLLPLFPAAVAMIEEMRAKDADLYAEVGGLSPGDAIQRWREVYPEDFVGVQRTDTLETAARMIH